MLVYRDRKLAVIEAKRAGLGHTAGVGQAKDYATRLKARFAYASNGLGWYGIDMQTGTEGDLALCWAYVRFTLAPLSRAERAGAAKATGLNGYEREMRGFLEYVLEAYERHGVDELASRKIADFLRIRYGGTNDAKRALGPVDTIRKAFVRIQAHLYQ